MWIYLPATSRSSPDAEVSTSLSDSQSQTLAASVAWRTMPRSPAFWRLAWKKGALNLLRSGVTSEPSTANDGVTRWMESWAGSPVPTCPSQGNKPASTESTADYGGSSPASYAKFSPDGSLLKTSLQSSLWEQDEPYSENFTPSGSMRSGYLYERPTWEPVTSESECSFWPTADANSASYSNGVFGENLREASVNWPTPRSEDSEGAGNHPEATDSLTGATRNWATPHAPRHHDSDHSESTYLGREIQNWKTGRDWKGGDASPETLEKNARPLNEQATTWATPHANAITGAGAQGRDGGLNLQTQVAAYSHPVPATQDGPDSSNAIPFSRPRLNPVFVCWLMGWPFWWTHPEPINSAPQAMALWRSRARRHLLNLFGG